ncbi:MAG: hypothetical protein IJV83_00055 [Clostridia bacterium]|nr:hypothetical protein [Clostridia bacterium]
MQHWTAQAITQARERIGGMTSEEYTSAQGQELHVVQVKLEYAKACMEEATLYLLDAETAKG